ncbi:MAG: hypothetical protein A2Y10_14280 [Planctomycetes bacterium GWF2_41_51]|nr:MAG: hypothetical protein A2Y10_14280 [Planctomycetes bacterium GWF2_41_51]HBG28733.1 hypothetical protein [Phycisphaerales bacterium]
MNQVNWMLAINTGALLWFVGMLDKFIINNQLFLKWWVLLTIISLLFPLIILYKFRIFLFRLNLELKNAKLKFNDGGFEKLNLDKFFNMSNKVPSSIAGYIADFFFGIGMISMVSYILTFFIQLK